MDNWFRDAINEEGVWSPSGVVGWGSRGGDLGHDGCVIDCSGYVRYCSAYILRKGGLGGGEVLPLPFKGSCEEFGVWGSEPEVKKVGVKVL